MPQLAHAYPAVQGQGAPCYGGCQTNMSKKSLRHCGCGLVCSLDLMIYLHRHRPGCATPFLATDTPDDPITAAEYEARIGHIRRRWLPIVYPFGTSGWAIAWGMNRYFRRFGLPLRARWGVKWEGLFGSIAELLEKDLPVVLAIGQNFPLPWRQNKLNLYTRTAAGHYCRATRAKAHFVNVTGMDEEWLQVSSWGRVYYISREEYRQYTLRHSCRLFCNILYLKEDV